MSVPVVVIVGAGASHASGTYRPQHRPPLTRDLFDCPKSAEFLPIYLLASNAARAITRMMQADDTVALEQALLSLRQDGHPHHRQMSLALPLYLQALMLAYSEELRAFAVRYSVLIDELLKLPTRIIFVSLNYDTLLDANLGAFSKLQSINDYVSESRKWSLVKPHGSANWFVVLDQLIDPTAPPEDLVVPEGPIHSVPAKSFPLFIARGADSPLEAHGLTNRYPAIALPEGPKDQLVLPPRHLDHFTWSVAQAQELDLLVLGYSGLDTEVLDLITQSDCRIRRMTIVNRDPASTLDVYRTIESHGVSALWPDTFDGSYEEWIDRDGLHRWVKEFGGLEGEAYPSLTSPQQLEDRIAARPVKRSTGSDQAMT